MPEREVIMRIHLSTFVLAGWLSDDRTDEIMQLSILDGTMVVSFPAPSGSPQGLAFDGTGSTTR